MSLIAIALGTRNLLRRKADSYGDANDAASGRFSTADFLVGALQSSHRALLQAVEPLSESEMSWRPFEGTESAGFVIWHVARVQDALIHRQILKKPEAWVTHGWAEQFGLPIDETGQEYSAEQRANFQEPPKAELLEYLTTTFRAAQRAIDEIGSRGLDVATEQGMERTRYLVIITNHANMHAGAVNYIRDILQSSRQVPAQR